MRMRDLSLEVCDLTGGFSFNGFWKSKQRLVLVSLIFRNNNCANVN